ncbi:ribosomal protein S18 acetylase RimI-like enzyme [Nocardia kruczakiae]|uniref:Ribosomal protein S18 acetylase RimI-like enzyme n=1 Tax=Nocardia kruczakiae TaxID=261477 RepID=A0ABU1XDN9_9NOCA|nr:GNAT family N-acetyltransferase [Nocardia kruczakiae]MDR7168659.1 ribosomal protein S18 acetylase RimI-like enzyme [Nocardia kruczakiae]
MSVDPPSIDGLTFQHYTATEAQAVRDQVERIFRDSYTDAIESGEEFEAPEAFMHRFDTYADPSRTGFELVMARSAEEPVGQTWGWPLGGDSKWWSGLQLDEGDAEAFTSETGSRTFALSELMVRKEFTGRGIARALHDELLHNRSESRATLLVRPDNARAYETYLRWGWNKAGTLRPDWPSAPRFDVLIYERNQQRADM